MEPHRCLICIGSNCFPQDNMKLAEQALRASFPDIVFGEEMITSPLGFTANTNNFHNRLAYFNTSLDAEEVSAILKETERKAGRMPEDKIKEIVKLDIDLLQFDQRILKPGDMQREYVRKGIEGLNGK